MTYRLGSADFDPSSGEVRTATGTTRLPTKAASLLEALVERPGEILTREEIRELLWPGGRVEFDQGINFLIRTIRRALDESAKSPHFIETLPKRGYRFIAPVSKVESPSATPIEAPSSDKASPGGPVTMARRTLPWLLVAGVSALLAFTLLGRPTTEPPGGMPPPPLPLLAIIPLADRDAAPQAQAQARAVAEALTTDFTTRLDARWRILGPAATAGIAADGAESLTARATLGACLVLSGSVRSLDDFTTVLFLQVIRTSDQAHLWAHMDTTTIDGMVRSALESAVSAARRLEAGGGEPPATGCPI